VIGISHILQRLFNKEMAGDATHDFQDLRVSYVAAFEVVFDHSLACRENAGAFRRKRWESREGEKNAG
jgi:hypothetical protein